MKNVKCERCGETFKENEVTELGHSESCTSDKKYCIECYDEIGDILEEQANPSIRPWQDSF